MESLLDAPFQTDPSESVAVDGMGPAISAWVADGRKRISGQELAEEEEELHKNSVSDAKERELSAWEQFKVSSPIKEGDPRVYCGYTLGTDVESGGWEEDCGGTAGGRGLQGLRFEGGRHGYSGMR